MRPLKFSGGCVPILGHGRFFVLWRLCCDFRMCNAKCRARSGVRASNWICFKRSEHPPCASQPSQGISAKASGFRRTSLAKRDLIDSGREDSHNTHRIATLYFVVWFPKRHELEYLAICYSKRVFSRFTRIV